MAVTQQYLDIHQVVFEGGTPVLARVTSPDAEGICCAYLPIQDEKFFLAIYINTKSGLVCGIHTESWHRVSLRATSETMSAREMAALTALPATTQWSKGQARSCGHGFYSFSALHFTPNPEPDTFEHKLEKLLDFLEQDVTGIQQLLQCTNCGIDVTMDMHNGTGMLGGPFLSAHTIQRVARLGLDIEFDLFVSGKPFRD
ncbi:DUF4279 domain-containing protein [Hymenobacter pini]|uniref:DUF4279 domain-containing protein n=1 Tax=Hymenobacter pini TaxID=2880879 RepID=UPI001CF1FAE4|nr:DUF4279 domain-containing protein [Hymenobacter pini]MCA8829058.1 DUF4279 domain-containing protein [Hymenobacter pini]